MTSNARCGLCREMGLLANEYFFTFLPLIEIKYYSIKQEWVFTCSYKYSSLNKTNSHIFNSKGTVALTVLFFIAPSLSSRVGGIYTSIILLTQFIRRWCLCQTIFYQTILTDILGLSTQSPPTMGRDKHLVD